MFPLGLTGSPQDINRVVSLLKFCSSSDTGPDPSRIQVINCIFHNQLTLVIG